MGQIDRNRDGTRTTTTPRTAKSLAGWVMQLIVAGAALMLAASAAAQTPPAGNAGAAPSGAATGFITSGVDGDGVVRLTVNGSTVVATRAAYKKISIGNPEIADVNPIGPGNILVTARKPGSTQLVVWDADDRSQVVDVVVTMDVRSLQDQLKAMFPGTSISVSQLNGSIALQGRVPNLEVAEQAAAVAQPFGGGAKVLNLLEVSGGQQVMLQVRFAEVSRSATSALGINGNYASGAFLGGSNIGQVNPSSHMLTDSLVGATPPFSGINLDAATAINPAVTLYGAGQIGNFYLEYFLNALRQNQLMRMLAEPNLIAISGQEAKFLAGGEFPVPVTQGGGTGGVAVTVEYRKFGVQLRFVPVVLGDGRIRLRVAPEVSDLDFSTAVRFNGFVIPGLTSRQVDTTIELADGQTFAIAGLLNNNVTASKDVTPLLGDLPIIGALFRSVRYQRKETELVVLVTPRLVEGMNPDQVPALPGEHWRHPSENDLFWNRDLGGEVPDKRRAARPTTGPAVTGTSGQPVDPNAEVPRFHGSYGFVPATTSASGASDATTNSTTSSTSEGQ